MQDDCIAVALRVPQLKILGQEELENYFEVTVIYRLERSSVIAVVEQLLRSMTGGCSTNKTGD